MNRTQIWERGDRSIPAGWAVEAYSTCHCTPLGLWLILLSTEHSSGLVGSHPFPVFLWLVLQPALNSESSNLRTKAHLQLESIFPSHELLNPTERIKMRVSLVTQSGQTEGRIARPKLTVESKEQGSFSNSLSLHPFPCLPSFIIFLVDSLVSLMSKETDTSTEGAHQNQRMFLCLFLLLFPSKPSRSVGKTGSAWRPF